MTLNSACYANSTSAQFTNYVYNVGSSPNNFTTTVSFNGLCMADPVPEPVNNNTNTTTETFAGKLMVTLGLAVMSLMSVALF